ncbi:hypothetical protein [Xenorhabdus ehlersii]|uniref:Uncharacterized protein n=1 Tax=Xenorhabdus ehlersii TaxID=290111 RepID=A0A2D0IKQ6_9GAMM|nr:hypothetical protein [Xenorhabdus ehlersii]PHM22372.1 hypothetical protein Xehl_03716 [Xenorhabdus ehlersii]RKE90542.1 hypothetical protein BDE27_2416 [Xenorhabdus ehlersii]
MHIETSNVVKIQITDVPCHDPIHIYLEDYGNKMGRITISEYGDSWSAFWPAMGGSLTDFVLKADNGYLIGCLAPKLETDTPKYKRMDSRLNAVKAALRRLHVHTVESQPNSNPQS